MKFFIRTIGAVTLLGSSLVHATPQVGNVAEKHGPTRVEESAFASVPVESQVPSLMQIEMDSCHKRDTRPREGANYPCVSQAWIDYTCRANGTSVEHLKAQQDCMCGEGSSFFQDAVGCSACKTGYGLQGLAEHPFWVDFYKRLHGSYCGVKPEKLTGDFYQHYLANGPSTNYPPARGDHGNIIDNKYGGIGVVAVKAYYPDAPKRQGPGKFTPIPAVSNIGAAFSNATKPARNDAIPVDGLLAVPAVILVNPDGNNPISTTSKPLTASLVGSGSRPTTLVRVTAMKWNSTAPIRPATRINTSALVPTSVANQNTSKPDAAKPLVVNGNTEAYLALPECSCVMLFKGTSMNNFDFVCTTVEIRRGSFRRIETPEDWDMAKQLPDASNVQDCKEELQGQGITGRIVPKIIVVPESGNKLPSSGKVPIYDQTTGPSGQKTGGACNKCLNGNNTPGNMTPVGGSGNRVPTSQSGAQPGGNRVPTNQSGVQPGSSGPGTGSGNRIPTGGSGNRVPTNQSGAQPGNDAPNDDTAPAGESDNRAPIGRPIDTRPTGQCNKGPGNTPCGSGSTIPTSGPDNTRPTDQSNKEPGNEAPNKQTPTNQNELDACAEQARIQTSCDNKQDCMCKQPFFNVAIACARQWGLACAAAEYWTQFYLELQYQFCEKKAVGEDLRAAFNNQMSVWDETRNPDRRKQFN